MYDIFLKDTNDFIAWLLSFFRHFFFASFLLFFYVQKFNLSNIRKLAYGTWLSVSTFFYTYWNSSVVGILDVIIVITCDLGNGLWKRSKSWHRHYSDWIVISYFGNSGDRPTRFVVVTRMDGPEWRHCEYGQGMPCGWHSQIDRVTRSVAGHLFVFLQ